MSSSMQVVADQLFIDKDTAMIAAAGEDYARLLTEIGDRVFTGYELTDVKLDVGETTQVKLYARPWNKVIEKPLIDLQFSGVEPQTGGAAGAAYSCAACSAGAGYQRCIGGCG